MCVCVCREEGERECVRIDLERESEMAGKPRDGGPMPKHAKTEDFGAAEPKLSLQCSLSANRCISRIRCLFTYILVHGTVRPDTYLS